MQLALLQLGDFHLNSDRHPVLGRADQIAAAVGSLTLPLNVDALVILMTGDLAHSGKREEYALAGQFFTDLLARLRARDPRLQADCLLVPGNHDCNLEHASDVRQSDVIEPKLPTIAINGALVGHFLAVQDDFFQFCQTLQPDSPATQSQRLFHRVIRAISGQQVVFNCFNTAWLTQNPERPAKLYFPMAAAAEMDSNASAALSVTIFHHPYNWLDPENARVFKRLVEDFSDIVLTGHEHVGDSYVKERIAGQHLHFFEGEPMWDPRENRSAFNLIVIDLDSSRYQVNTLTWESDAYRQGPPTTWRDFARNPARGSQRFENNLGFLEQLDDMGIGFTHPRRRTLSLGDVFVYPDLSKRYVQAKLEGKKPPKIRSAEVPAFVLTEDRILVVGADRSGRTAMASRVYLHLKANGIIPILLNGQQLHSDETRLLAAVHSAYSEQYSPESLEHYKQLPRERRAFIVDDFHKAKLNAKRGANVLRTLERLAAKVVVLVNDLYEIEQVAEHADASAFGSYYQCEIMPLGHYLRGKLITHWVSLETGDGFDQADLIREIDIREKLISTLLGTQLLPSFPIFVLGMLQAIEASKNLNTASGSYGELYEALITDRFRIVSGRATEVGTKYVFVARMAYYMFVRSQIALSCEDVAEVSRQYFAQFAMLMEPAKILTELEEAQVLYRINGHYRFRYPYYYHFFVARYFRDNIGDPEEGPRLRPKLREMADHIAFEEYANILVFFMYFSRDIETIERILHNAAHIYADTAPCDLDADAAFVNQLYVEASKPLLLPASGVDENRAEYRARMDEREEDDEADGPWQSPVAYDDGLSDVIKLNIAFKTLQVLGQVIRNFPGVLKAELKTRIARESYQLGLRVLGTVMAAARDNLDSLRRYFAEILKEQRARPISGRELAEKTDEFLIWLTGACAYAVVKRISQAVGTEELSETYRSVVRLEEGKLAVAVIDLSIRLDHFGGFPEDEVLSMLDRVEKNRFVFSLVRDLVVDYFYLFRMDERTKRRIGSRLDFTVGDGTGHEPALLKG